MQNIKMYTYIEPEILLYNFFENKRHEILKAYAEKKQIKNFYQLVRKIDIKRKELAYKRLHKLKTQEEINEEVMHFIYLLQNSPIIGNIFNDFLKMYTTK